ncbi:hypothetical protein A2635_03735, partial [Candidatus Peribacteria bacterium RIFCSPHIGHO2_01_FULL_51_9]
YTGGVGSGDLVTDPEHEVDLTLLWSVWKLLLKHYIVPEDVRPTPLLFGAVRGLVRAVGDPYTTFMSPEENTDFRQALNGELQGIGAQLTMRDEQVVIVAPLKGSPAEKAGLEADDIVVKVDDGAIDGLSLDQVVHRIRGPKGTSVTIGVVREGHPDVLSFTIERDDIHVPSVEHEIKKTQTGTVAYIAINQFGDGTTHEVTEALKTLLREEPEGVVLDLRFNGGGYLEGAVEITSLFLPKGKVVSVERRDSNPQPFYVSGRPIAPVIPLVILINRASASASEIVAGALQDHGRAIIVGMKSFGKGTVQEVIDLPGGSSLRVTTSRWLTPNGRDLGKEGVEPNVVIDRTREDFEAKRDPQLEKAMEVLLEGT